MVTFHGNWNKAGNRYTDLDFKILKNERAQGRLISKFEKSEHSFDFHFYKGPRSNWDTSLQGEKNAEWVNSKFGIDIEPNDDKITVLVTSNIGSPKYPLTPWIIAHRISHAIWQQIGFNSYERSMRDFQHLVGDDVYYTKWLGCAIGTMRSCRQRTLARTGEIFHELFAQNLLTGSITLNHIENRVLVRKRGRNCEYRYFNDDKVNQINSAIDRLENSVYYTSQHLHEMYGSVIVV